MNKRSRREADWKDFLWKLGPLVSDDEVAMHKRVFWQSASVLDATPYPEAQLDELQREMLADLKRGREIEENGRRC